MRSIIAGGIFSLVLTSGCLGSQDAQTESAANALGDVCRLEGVEIGLEGTSLYLGQTTMTFHDWIAKPGSPGQYLGFSLAIDGAPYDHYIVKAGTTKYIADGTGWTHPDGVTSSSNAISNVDFCECDAPDPAPPPCDNPDGCDGGGGGTGPLL